MTLSSLQVAVQGLQTKERQGFEVLYTMIAKQLSTSQ